jgi:tetratricopeptide (TPR) repeat protein
VPIYATGEEDGTHFYAMELIQGPSLDHVIRQLRQPGGDTVPPANPDATGPYVAQADSPASSPPPLSSSSLGSGSPYFDAVARMVAEVADALDYAHQNGVIHRDIKPSNLLLSPQGRLSINDFGLARVLEQPGITLTGEFVGTPAYSSPEQITGGRIPLDHRTDIYSLGATLYELLTLQPPFTGRQRDQVLAQIVQKEPRAPRRLNRKAPVDLETICLKALEKDPDRRYQTAGQMADDLRRYVNRFAIAARRAGPVERLQKWMRRHPGLAAGVGLALMALSLAGFFAVQSWRDRQERLAAEEKTRQRMLDEKQKQAVQDILGGDFEVAEEAIRDAEALGAAPEWVQWRRGQIAYHRSVYGEAVPLLEQAVQKVPTSLAANWLLVLVYMSSHDYEKVAEIAARLNGLPVNEEEEYLYKGIVTTTYTPEEGLALLDKAVAERGSLIAFTQRASALARVASEKTDFDRMQQALDDITAAKRVMRRRDNAMVLTESVLVHHLATILYQQNQKTREFEEALRIADTDARALALFPSIPRAVTVRGIFLADNQQEQEALRWYEEGLKHQTVASQVRVRDAYAWLLYQRGEADKALQVIGQAGGAMQDFSRVVFVRELPDGPRRARTICDAMSEWQATHALLFLGEKEAALELLRRDQPNNSHELGMLTARVAEYFKHPDAAIMKSLRDFASRNKGFQVSAHFAIGLRQLAEGDRSGARQHFQEGVAVRSPHWVPDYNRCRAFLVRMQKDPTWPPWIPVKP